VPKPTCIDCGAPFTPTLHGQRRCLPHQERGRASRSPTTRAQDAEYRRNRALVLAGSPPCALRTHCDGAPATTADHVVPVAAGGTNTLSNLRPACLSCNAARGARS
jgi:5-methylcytosine-specific restriction enzyme A